MGVDGPFDEILSRASEGDPTAFADLYRAYAPGVLGYLRAQGASDAEDLMGEVFVSVARRIASFEGDERKFRSWIFTVAH
ncbi:MAG TPA: sigma factor, partial [Actinomycetota bacterium]|nr:sigma factor [Actinomycetota bacterium]